MMGSSRPRRTQRSRLFLLAMAAIGLAMLAVRSGPSGDVAVGIVIPFALVAFLFLCLRGVIGPGKSEQD